jgi:hypothetical protein
MRASVRALVAVTRARQQHGLEEKRSLDEARHLLTLANTFLLPESPALVAVGGFSGTGKSKLSATLAPMLAPAPGAVHIRTDIERKRLFGVGETDRLSANHYRPEVSEEVYRIVFNKAARVLAAGHSVVVDAVFSKLEEREAVAEIAKAAGRAFAGLWLEAPADTLLERVAGRRGDASDADAAVVREQLARKLGTLAWTRIDARGTPEATSALARDALGKRLIAPRR